MKLKNLFSIIIIFILSLIIYYLTKRYYWLEWMKKEMIFLISFLTSIVIIKTIKIIIMKPKKIDLIYLISYLLLLIIILFHRPFSDQKEIILDFNYLNKWLKILFKNKTVFTNIFGNILLFIPLGIILNYQTKSLIIKIIYLLWIIMIIEYIQYKLNLGIFDILDIVLNLIGGIIGIILSYQKRS